MEVKTYDPRSFLRSYTQLPEGGLPPDIQQITRNHLDPYEWYENLVRKLKTTQDINVLGETPLSETLSYLDVFISDGHIEAAASLLDYLLKYYASADNGLSVIQSLLPEKSFLQYLKIFLQDGLTEEAILLVRNYGNKDNLLWIAADSGFLEGVKFLISQGASDITGSLTLAANKGHQDIIDYLLFLQASNPMTSSKEIAYLIGTTARSAYRGGHHRLATYLQTLNVGSLIQKSRQRFV